MKRRSLRIAAIGAMGAAAVALATSPAFAKGGIDLTVTPRTVAVGHTVKVAAGGNDDAAAYLRTCIQQRTGTHGTWHTATCGKLSGAREDAKANASVKAAHRGALQFRAVLYGSETPHDKHPVVERTSPVKTVTVR
ncbi:hypothetical protein [Streptomyces pinistramenti]|uniref:hypothetical protein n=1 Tax=Streptomyces pinistramenti TaxID=2884812 RepID=UPI001D05DFD0|nr:hypothetical protein [Streptomyces pinistramenti]MCB5906175.1 hypothetical protein [Streptomyces pinistramenti]